MQFGVVAAWAESGAIKNSAPSNLKLVLSDDLQSRLQQNPAIALIFQKEGPLAAYQAWAPVVKEASNDAKDWALLGELALLADMPEQAREALERAVLTDPELPGAWLDLSVALLRLGEVEQSRQYLDYVQRQFAPQEKMQLIVNQFQLRAEQLLNEKYRWHYVLTTGLGYDSNANSGLSTNLITLTSGLDRIPLTLSETYQARQDFYAVLGLQAKQERGISGTDWKLQYGYGLRQRQFFKENNFSSSELGAQVQGVLPTRGGSYLLVGGQFEYVRLGHQSVLADTRLTLGQDIPWNACRVMPGVELENRQHLLESQLSGQITWFMGQAVCQWGFWRAGIEGRLGLDRPTQERVGGKIYRSESQFYIDKIVSERTQIKLSTSLAKASDQEGYSPWLENEAKRHTLRIQYRSELTYQWAPHWQTVWGLEKNTTHSNISIFVQSGWQTYFLIRAHY